MIHYASVRRAILRQRINALPDEQKRQYSKARDANVQAAKSTYERDSLPEAVLEDIDDLILTGMETGLPIELDPAAYQKDLDEYEINDQARKIRQRAEAQRRVQDEQFPPTPPPTPVLLDDFIETARNTEQEWRIDGLWPAGGRVLCAAAYKAGKTSLMANLLRSLVDGDPFLDRYPVTRAEGAHGATAVLLIDTEMTEQQLGRWLDQVGIRNQRMIEVLCLRGRLSGFNILDRETREKWARAIEGAEIVILDNLRPVLDALGLDENREAGKYLTAWDEMMSYMAVRESLIVTHTGHNQERARGDSALLASNDAMWTLIRDGEEATAPRYFKAIGRDVDAPEARLDYNPDTRRLTLAGGSRKQTKAAYRLQDVLDFLANSPGTSKTGIKHALPGDDKAIDAAIETGVAQGRITKQERRGRGGGFAYSLTPVTQVNPGAPEPTNPGNPGYREPGFGFSSTEQPSEAEPPDLEHCPRHPVTPRPDICETCKAAS